MNDKAEASNSIAKTLFVTLTVFLCSYVSAQDESDGDEGGEPAIVNEEKERLKTEREIAKLKEDIAVSNKNAAVAKKDEAAAKAVQSETTGPSGNVEIIDDAKKAGYFALIIAYETLNATADDIATLVASKTSAPDDPRKIILTTEMTTAEHAALWALLNLKMTEFEDGFDLLVERHDKDEQQVDDVGFGITSVTVDAIAAMLGGLVDIASFFKVNQEIYGKEIALDDNVLVAEVAQRILEMPGEYSVIVPSLSIEGTGKLFTDLSTLVKKRDELAGLLDKVREENKSDIEKYAKVTSELGKLKTTLAKLKAAKPTDPTKIKEVEEQIEKKETERGKHEAGNKKWVEASTEIGKAKTAFDAFYASVTTPPEKGKKSPMEVIAPIDEMKALQGEGLFVVLDIASHGGEVNVTSSAWSGGRVNYIGGSVSVYFITKGDGEVIGAGSSIQYGSGAYKARGGVKTLETQFVEETQRE